MLSLLTLVHKHNTIQVSDVGFVHGRIPHDPVVVLDGDGVTGVAIILRSFIIMARNVNGKVNISVSCGTPTPLV